MGKSHQISSFLEYHTKHANTNNPVMFKVSFLSLSFSRSSFKVKIAENVVNYGNIFNKMHGYSWFGDASLRQESELTENESNY